MVQVKQEVKQEMIEAVFGNKKLRRRFTNPKRDKAICELRAQGVIYDEIAERFGVSQATCIRLARKVVLLYRVFIEREEGVTGDNKDNTKL